MSVYNPSAGKYEMEKWHPCSYVKRLKFSGENRGKNE
jgi:hypothetical protein